MVVYGVRKVLWMSSMSEVPPKGEYTSGILLYYYHYNNTVSSEGKVQYNFH